MPLTDTQVRKAKAAEKAYKLADTGGLFLYVTPSGFKSWRLKYRFAGKEKLLTFGGYPETSLQEARDRRDAARRQLREHKDPTVVRKQERAAAGAAADQTFEKLAREWHEARRPHWSAAHADTVMASLERDLFKPWGTLPITEIDIPMVVQLLKKVQARGAVESAHRLRQRISEIFVFAASMGIVRSDPAERVGKVLKPMPSMTKMPALVTFEQLRQLQTAVEAPTSTASAMTKLASRFLSLTMARPGTLRAIPWAEIEGIDWETGAATKPTWRISADRMKQDLDRKSDAAFEHLVPLSDQAVDVLRVVRRLTGRGPWVFSSIRWLQRPMSENTIGYAYRREGFGGQHVPHGWRAAFSTLMNERAERAGRAKDREAIDLFLAHVPKGLSGSERAYNRADYLDRRRELAQEWADLLLDGARPVAELLIRPSEFGRN